MKPVINPERTITSESIGARIIPGMLPKRIPVPKRYTCPFSRTISAIYMTSVMADAITDGNQTERNCPFPKRNDPVNIPAVTPKRMKYTAIKVAERGDT